MSDRDDPSRAELEDRVAELESTLEELRTELRQPPRGPLGLPRPPRPREVLRFTDEYAIPTAIAVLEANVRMLELLQRVLRATRGAGRGSEATLRAADVGRESLARLDDALSELSTALEGSDLPSEPEARRLLEEARSLNDEVRTRLAADVDAAVETDEGESNEGVEVNVEEELQSIKDDLDADVDEDPDEVDESDDDGTDGESSPAPS